MKSIPFFLFIFLKNDILTIKISTIRRLRKSPINWTTFETEQLKFIYLFIIILYDHNITHSMAITYELKYLIQTPAKKLLLVNEINQHITNSKATL